jgi:hypothetical protein
MSKFLRQMTALSKKPSDYAERESVSHAESVSPTDSISHTASVSPIKTVSPTDSPKPRGQHRPKPRQARLAQDGHSHAEQAIYAALWEAGTPRPDGNRTVTMGLGRLSKVARLSENNCRLNIRSLVKKLALEEIGAEDSRARIGKTYKVYAYSAILSRRRAAGMEWVIRTKGVAFVDRNGQDILTPHTDSVSPTDSIPDTESVSGSEPRGAPPTESGGGSPTDSIPPYRNSFRNKTEETSSSNVAPLIERLAALGIHLDDDAGRRIVSRCQNTDRTATVEEIAVFAELKVRQLAKRRNIENWPGLLMAAVPAYFDPPATEVTRYREAQQQEREDQMRIARQVLEDPQSSEDERAWARSLLPPADSG